MVLGIYYLKQERPGNKGEGKFFKSVNEAILAYENKVITLQTKIIVHCHKTMPDGTVLSGNVQSTLGRFLFNEILPQDLGFVDRSVPGNELLLEVDFLVGKKQLKQFVSRYASVYESKILRKDLVEQETSQCRVNIAAAEAGDDQAGSGYC